MSEVGREEEIMKDNSSHTYRYIKIRKKDFNYVHKDTLWVPTIRVVGWFIEGVVTGVVLTIIFNAIT